MSAPAPGAPRALHANVLNSTIHFAICIPANCFSFRRPPEQTTAYFFVLGSLSTELTSSLL